MGLLLLGALALRARRLGVPTLTGDEWFMLRNAQEGPAWIIAQARVFEPHPLLYYLGIWAWIGLVGSSEWAMRYPSALFGLLTCAAVWRLGREIGGPTVALGALLLAAVNPYQVAQAQNARNYAMVAALTTLATGLLLIAARREERLGWRRYAVGMLLALHTHLNAALTALGHVLWYVGRAWLRRERPSPGAIAAGAAVAALFLPWLVYAAPALLAYRGYYPERVGPGEVILRTLATFSFGQYETPRRLLIGLVAGLALVGAARAARRATAQRARTGGLLVLLSVGLPVLGAAALFLVRPMFEERYLIVAAPPLIVLIAFGAGALGRIAPPFGIAALLGLAALTGPFLVGYYPAVEASRPDWRGLASWIARSERPGDRVLTTGRGVADAYGYYGRGRSPLVVVDDESAVEAQVARLLEARPRGVFHLAYWDAPPDRLAHDALTRVGFAGETRWFRNQPAQYFGLPSADDPPPTPLDAGWMETVELAEALVAPSTVPAGEALRVRLTWRTNGTASDLKISLRLVEPSDGRTRAQIDRRPLDEARPFPSLKAGEELRDGHALFVPEDLAPGRYALALLLYRPEDGKAVPPDRRGTPSVGGVADLVKLADVEVVPRVDG
ncbi:MAG TPA: glycosyltransferase family 39 protein [Chloroflexota bacterium]